MAVPENELRLTEEIVALKAQCDEKGISLDVYNVIPHFGGTPAIFYKEIIRRLQAVLEHNQ